MALQKDIGADELVYLHTDCVSVTIKGSASHPAFSGISMQERASTLKVSCDSPFDITLSGSPSVIWEQALDHAQFGHYQLQPLFFEQQRYELVIEPAPGHSAAFWHENAGIRRAVTPIGRSAMLSGVICFGNEIGMSDLVILVDGRNYLTLTLEVFPSKIDYQEDYRAIVADVTAEVYNLVFDFLKKTYDTFEIDAKQHSSPVEFFTIIRKIFTQFTAAADIVLQKPHHILKTEYRVLPGHKVHRTDAATIRWLEKHPQQAQRKHDKIAEEKALTPHKYVTYDTNENRLAKYMLTTTVRRLEEFRRRYGELARDTDPEVIASIDAMADGLRRRCRTGSLRDVEAIPARSGMSLVFGMAPGYRELYRCYLLLQHSLSVTGSIFHVSVKDLAVLYEYWCFIKLNSLMKQRYQLLAQDIIKVSGSGLFVSLVKGQRSRVRYLNPENGEIITLSYNPKAIDVPTVSQKPDNVLCLEKQGAKIRYEYVFDAKYRINAALADSYYHRAYHTPGPQEEDINTMHRYRDAIVYQSGAEPYERTMFGAYVLFPYHNESEYRDHRFFKSIAEVNIGGLPFLPSATGMVTEMLDELISDSPDSAFERATLPAGIEERLARVDWTKKEVLIGFVKDDARLQTCLDGLFYYTYCSSIARENLPLHYVALYLKNAGITYYGKVITTQQVPRHALPGTTSRPEEMCWRFDVAQWQQLPEQIRPERYGPSPIAYTNLFLLMHSRSYPELHLRSDAEYRFYIELRRRSDKAAIDPERSGFELDNCKVLFDSGKIQVFQAGKPVDTCTVEEFTRHPNATFRRLQQSCLSGR